MSFHPGIYPVIGYVFLLIIILLPGCGTKSIGEGCEDPIIKSAICSVEVVKKDAHQAIVIINYVHTGEYGKTLRIFVRGVGAGRSDVIGSMETFFAIPGRHRIEIPVGFIIGSSYAESEYHTDFIRIEFRWLDEARNHYKQVLMRAEVGYQYDWIKEAFADKP